MEIVLSAEESILLEEVLEQYHRELLREIARTHHHEFKLTLRRKEAEVESILAKLSQAKHEHAAGSEAA